MYAHTCTLYKYKHLLMLKNKYLMIYCKIRIIRHTKFQPGEGGGSISTKCSMSIYNCVFVLCSVQCHHCNCGRYQFPKKSAWCKECEGWFLQHSSISKLCGCRWRYFDTNQGYEWATGSCLCLKKKLPCT